MASYLYDEALLSKLQKWTSNTQVHVFGTEETKDLLSKIADETNDNPIKLPIIALRRDGGYSIDTTGKRPLSYNGMRLDASDAKVSVLNAIPITLNYHIDVYTRLFKEADAYMRNLVFNIINYPKLQIDIPYNGKHVLHTSNIRITSPVQDLSSSTTERLMKGQFTRMSIDLSIDDAYLWDVREKDTLSIEIDVVDVVDDSNIEVVNN